MLRFGGGLHIVGGKLVVECELDTGAAARRLRTAINEIFGFTSELLVINGSGIRRGTRYMVRLVADGADTLLHYEATAQVAGKLAQIGARLVDMAAKKMADDFFGNFVAQLQAAQPAAAPAEVPVAEPQPATEEAAEEKAVETVAQTVAPRRRAWLVLAVVVLIILAGSLWIMASLNHNMLMQHVVPMAPGD